MYGKPSRKINSKVGLFMKSLSIGIFGFINLSCNSSNKLNTPQVSHSKVKIIIEGDSEIDDIIFTKFGSSGFSEEDVKPFKHETEITFNEPINDFYQLALVKDDNYIIKQFWLKGNEIILKGRVVKNQVQIDTVINSPFYYYTENIYNKYSKSIDSNETREEINNGLLSEINKNIDNTFSNELSSIYLQLNVGQTDKLKKLHALIEKQNPKIKSHFQSIHDQLKKQIEVVSIKTEAYELYNETGETTQLNLKKDSVYMLDFWFMHCKPCLADHKTLRNLRGFLDEKNIETIGISIDYKKSDWMDFIDKKDYKWKNYNESRKTESRLSTDLGIYAYPTYIIIKGNGEILNRNNELEKSIAFLEEMKD